MIAQKIAYNVLISGLAKVVAIALALFGIGLLARYLGPEGFGKYAVTLAYFGFFMALGDFGLHSIMTREISRNDEEESSIVSKIFTLRLVISLTVFFLTCIFVWFLPYEQDVRSAILVVGGAFIFSSSYGLLNGIFQKHLAMDRVALAEFVGKVLQMGVIVLLVRFDLGFLFSAFAILTAMVSNFLIIMYFAGQFVKISLSWDTSYWKEFLKKSYPMGISALATFLYFKVDTILLSFLQGSDQVGIYGAAYKIIETLIFFPAMVIGLVFPLLSRYIFTNTKLFLQVANTTVKFFMLVLIPAVVSLEFLAVDVIRIIGGAEFDLSVPVLRILTLALIGIFFGNLFMNICIAGNQQRKLMFILIGTAIFNISLNLILIPHFSYFGAAVTSVITEIGVMSAVLYIIHKRTPYRLYIPQFWLLMGAALLMVGVNILLPFSTIINALLAVGAYIAFIFIFKIVTVQDLNHIRPSNKVV